jgi:hypothetical protein
MGQNPARRKSKLVVMDSPPRGDLSGIVRGVQQVLAAALVEEAGREKEYSRDYQDH